MKRIQIPKKRLVDIGVGFTEIKKGNKANVYYKNEYLGTVIIEACFKNKIQIKVVERRGAQSSDFFLDGKFPMDCIGYNRKYDAELVARKMGCDDKAFGDNHKELFKWIERKKDVSDETIIYVYYWRWIKMTKKTKKLPKPVIPKKIGPVRCRCGRWDKNFVDEIYIWKIKGDTVWNIEIDRTGGLTTEELEGIINRIKKELVKVSKSIGGK
ncbi:hypothetical protein GF386_00910 [Candidatus Pacearchaeota archaeon]|nr:hypothetical protein [Candidatus Pacearchaeota archaeon]